ncbi:hypothetical protein H6G20_26045 [Desertifilum sp. FACHB-1129]|uniref:Uncharacterized protein n=2 Tax=Desertifilum tharense IPPAS B-1220 TaxID=1781255 RepID=A0ACD5GT76_9CYAN|nr:hypothetical protein [Desertifilum tharense]MBD2315133.1 hypothetical protein [Desertifilum sp. FACHB-1129]MBD2325070.1 hypothetical protein [Desertifilum sp. FACHB-866]MBD2335245.1 hypothetical protein [Desertifilum sp. FACHB-868]MCD8488438.1 hypothetical protein [Desertifilum sp.]MDA0213612.1 hypothetical protein [Cyanobacteria bacterium FC1]MDI9636255.1 hypothetical protein [Geitlerinema splendidum]NES95155.1 hypothetical protein [Desertifilum sp. SIO1I2]
MAHTFLMEAGRWTLHGNWLERDGLPIMVKGKTLVGWARDDWFTMVTRLVFPGTDREDISLQYRGRLDAKERQYTFVLQHSLLGRVEGEGWVTPESIVQRYWVLGDKQRRSSFETLHRLDENTYYLSSGIMAGHYLTSTMEATLERQLG